MNIYDSVGKQVGTLNKPEPVLQDGKWWEPVEYRKAEAGEMLQDIRNSAPCIRMASGHTVFHYWIMSEIPAPTTEQLKAIGMQCRDGKPEKCRAGDTVWVDDGCLSRLTQEDDPQIIGKCRWVLEPVEKEETTMRDDTCKKIKAPGEKGKPKQSCLTCKDEVDAGFPCHDCRLNGHYRNWTPKPPAPQVKGAVHTNCYGCNYARSGGRDLDSDACEHCKDHYLYTPAPQPAPTKIVKTINGINDDAVEERLERERAQPAPVKHYSCEGCVKLDVKKGSSVCIDFMFCFGPEVTRGNERRNYTPAPQPAPDTYPGCPPYRDTIEEALHDLNLAPPNCYVSMACTRLKNALAFQPAPAFTVEQIMEWLQYLYKKTSNVLPVGGAIEVIDNPQDGLDAVTQRKEA